MPYGILRFNKMKGGPAKALEAHHERQKEKYESNPDVDTSRKKENYHIITPITSYYKEIQVRIEEAISKNPKCKVRKDSIKFIDTLITASTEFFKNRPKTTRRFFNEAVKFLEKEIGRDNIFSAVVHMDERTPHIHICFIPITQDNRLSAKDIIGNRLKLVEWQDKFHDHMVAIFPELQRGESAAQTKRKHIPMQMFKQAMKIEAHMDKIQGIIGEMNAVNVMKLLEKREKLNKEMAKFIPNAHSFTRQMKSVKIGNQSLKAENVELEDKSRKMGAELSTKRIETAKAKADYVNLERIHIKLSNFLKYEIPEEWRAPLKEMWNQFKGMHKENERK